MTLVVARIIEDRILLISDSRITDPNVLRRSSLKGALKAVILHRGLCVCFSGNLLIAQDAISKLEVNPNSYFESETIIDQLFQEHRKGDCGADFLLVTLIPNTSITRIRRGQIERNLNAAWIGDYDAFSSYQQHFHNSLAQNSCNLLQDQLEQINLDVHKIFSKMTDAFISVIENNAHPTVDDFIVHISLGLEGFKYLDSLFAFNPNKQTIPAGVRTPLIFSGSAAEGGYSHSIMTPREAGIGAIGVYFFQGSFGALFYPARFDEVIIYKNIGAYEFKQTIRQNFGFEIEGPQVGSAPGFFSPRAM